VRPEPGPEAGPGRARNLRLTLGSRTGFPEARQGSRDGASGKRTRQRSAVLT